MRPYISYILLGTAGVLFLVTFFVSDEAERLRALEQEKTRQLAERERLEDRVQELKAVLLGMDEDPRVLERVAREELKVVRENEQLVLFGK